MRKQLAFNTINGIKEGRTGGTVGPAGTRNVDIRQTEALNDANLWSVRTFPSAL